MSMGNSPAGTNGRMDDHGGRTALVVSTHYSFIMYVHI
jgi:hypothetical protein